MQNIYAYLAVFLHTARKAGWDQSRIDAVLYDAKSSDYNHVVEVILSALLEIVDDIAEVKKTHSTDIYLT